jgi:hypothetical protein
LTLINYVYENGYIQNDVLLTKKEKNPTLRLVTEVLNNIRKNINKILISRFIVLIFIMYILSFLIEDSKSYYTLLFIIFFLQLLYLIYNSVRSVLNLYLILPLSYIRFYGFIVPFVEYENLLEFIIATIFIYPLSKFLEFTKQPRYGYKFISGIIGNVDIFRVIYYLIILILFFLFYIIFKINFIYVLIILYYFIFRFLSYLAINKSEIIKKNILENSKKIK